MGWTLVTVQEESITAWIRRSAIKEQLLAAIDNRAFVSLVKQDRGRLMRLLHFARRVDPDPWKDRVRDFDAWSDVKKLKVLASEALKSSRIMSRLSPQIALLLGILLNKHGEGEKWLRQVQLLHPADFALNLHLGLALAENRPEQSEGYYRAALAIRPQSTAAWTNLGNTLFRRKDAARAADAYRKALAIDPRHAVAWGNLASTLRRQNDLPGAVKAYRTALAINPMRVATWTNLGTALMELKDLPGATQAQRKALAIDPANAAVWNNFGYILDRQKHYAEAEAAYRRALAINPRMPVVWYNLANVLAHQKKLSEAEVTYRKLLAINPGHAEAHCHVGSVLLKQGRFAEALAHVKEGDRLGSSRRNWTYPSGTWVRECEQLLKLEQKLAAYMQGKSQIENPKELLQMGDLCWRHKKHYAAAARLYSSAFAFRPVLAEMLLEQHRCRAACCAALAAAGWGKDAANLSTEEKATFRGQAWSWFWAAL
jgi:Tfp pilus assembly protein PilF